MEKNSTGFVKALSDEEMFSLPRTDRRIKMQGPDIFELNSEVFVKAGVLLVSDRAIISCKLKETECHE